jgi:hypothetical protein
MRYLGFPVSSPLAFRTALAFIFGIGESGLWGVVSRLYVSSRSAFSFHWLHAVAPVSMPAMLFLSFACVILALNHLNTSFFLCCVNNF